jgi:hypothetical protein
MATATDIIGTVTSPLTGNYASVGTKDGGLGLFLTNVINLIFIAGGLFALINFLLAGWQFINAGADEKKITDAWSKITNSLIGLVVMAVSFIIISIISYLIFGKANWILNPEITGPK